LTQSAVYSNDSNRYDNVYGAVIMAQPLQEFAGSFNEYRTKANQLEQLVHL